MIFNIKMKIVVVILSVLVFVAADEKYSSENDNLDIDVVVKDPAEFKAYIDCFLDKRPCTPVPADFKKDIVEATRQSCEKCTTAQKHIFKVFLDALKKNRPEDYEEFKKKYDPDRKFFSSLEAAIAKA